MVKSGTPLKWFSDWSYEILFSRKHHKSPPPKKKLQTDNTRSDDEVSRKFRTSGNKAQ